MKKVGLLLIAVVLLGAGSAYLLLRTPATTADSGYADYLPADTLATISLRDVNGLSDIFPETAMGNFLSKETMGRILTDLHVEPEVIRNYEEDYDQLFSVVQNPAFRMIFGDDVDLALLSVDTETFSKEPQKALEQALVILATTSSSKALETFARSVLNEDVSEFKSGDLDMTRIRLDAENFAYAFTQGSRLLIARDPAAIERCVTARASGSTLQQEENFVAAIKFWQASSMSKTYSQGFVQLERLQSYLLASGDKELRDFGRYLQGIQFFASAGGRIKDGWKSESTSRYSYDALDPAIRELVDLASKQNTSLHLLEENPLTYSWASSLGATTLLETLSATDAEQYGELDGRLQQELGFSLEKVVQAFGPQYGMVLKEIVPDGLFPLPKVVLFLQVKDRQVAEALLGQIRQKVAAREMAREQEEQVGAYTMYSWALLPGEATQPAVLLTEDMLYLANGPSSLKQLFSAEKDRSRLPESVAEKLGVEFSVQVQAANNGVFVLWPARFAEQVKGAADWLAGIVEASRGGSITVLKDELLKLFQVTEVAVFVSDLFPDHGQAMVTFKETQEKEGVR